MGKTENVRTDRVIQFTDKIIGVSAPIILKIALNCLNPLLNIIASISLFS